MSISVDRTGTFRCRLLEKVVNKTKNGFPQLVAKVALTQLHDKDAGEDGKGQWFPIEDWDMETTAYVCLYGRNKKSEQIEPTFNKENTMAVFNWDGNSLAELDQADHTDLKFQVRITENNYEGARFPFQVDRIAEYDADPVDTLRKLDAKEIKDLDAQFSNLTASAKTAASAKSPKKPRSATTHPARVPADDGDKTATAPKSPKDMTPAEKKAAMKAKSDRIKAQAKAEKGTKKPEAPKKPTTPPPPDDEALPLPEAEGSLTKADAWGKIFEMRDETIDDKTVKELWDAAIEEVGGEGAKHADLDGGQWYQVKEIVLKDCGKF